MAEWVAKELKLRLCVVGCGNFARTFARAMGALRDEVELVFASRDLSRAEAYARRFNGSRAFGSYEEAASDDRVDAMYLCTPHHLHREHAVMAARGGKHILVEKPIARTLEEGQEIVSQAQQLGVTLMVAENYRFMPTVRCAKQLIESGTIGALRSVQLQEEAFFRPDQWRNNRALNGGGVLIDGGIHKVDILIYLVGMPEHIFAAALPPGLADVEAEDGLVMMSRNPSGVVGVINHSWTSVKLPVPPWVAVNGTGGRIFFEVGGLWVKVDDGSKERTLRFEDHRDGLAPMVREFRDSIAERREPLTGGAAGLDDLLVVLKTYESMRRGVSLSIG